MSQGCTPIGATHTVTDCTDNIARALDDRPALDIFKDDIEAASGTPIEGLGGHLFAALPVTGSDTGDYLVRDIIGVTREGGGMAIAAPLARGDKLMFCRRDRSSAIADLRRMAGDIKRRLDGPPRGAIYVSCLARGPNLFGPDSDEIRLIQSELAVADGAPLPLVGFFANGEISHHRLYTHTGVLTVFV